MHCILESGSRMMISRYTQNLHNQLIVKVKVQYSKKTKNMKQREGQELRSDFRTNL